MAKARLKTRARSVSVESFVKGIKDPDIRADAAALIPLMKSAAGAPPRVWGTSIIGFGDFHYVYESGREGDWFLIGFAPRKANLTLYLMSGPAAHPDIMETLGRFKKAGSCIHVRRLADLHLPTLKRLLRASVQATKKRYGGPV